MELATFAGLKDAEKLPAKTERTIGFSMIAGPNGKKNKTKLRYGLKGDNNEL
jgi:hypothetical protein